MSLRPIHLLLAGLAAAGAARADTLYKCIEEGGTVLYTNQKDAGKRCTVMSRDLPVSTVPAQPRTTRTPGDFPRVGAEEQKNRDSDRRRILEQELADEQQKLEAARKALSEQSDAPLPEERNAPRVVTGTGKDGKPYSYTVPGGFNQAKVDERLQRYRDEVALHERNIEALNRELAKLR